MNIAVVGLGFVGLTLSSVLASKNNNVIGIDTDNQKCLEIRNGLLPLFEPDLEKTLRVMLIVTGVTSPQITGPNPKRRDEKRKKDIENELGIEFI